MLGLSLKGVSRVLGTSPGGDGDGAEEPIFQVQWICPFGLPGMGLGKLYFGFQEDKHLWCGEKLSAPKDYIEWAHKQQ